MAPIQKDSCGQHYERENHDHERALDAMHDSERLLQAVPGVIHLQHLSTRIRGLVGYTHSSMRRELEGTLLEQSNNHS